MYMHTHATTCVTMHVWFRPLVYVLRPMFVVADLLCLFACVHTHCIVHTWTHTPPLPFPMPYTFLHYCLTFIYIYYLYPLTIYSFTVFYFYHTYPVCPIPPSPRPLYVAFCVLGPIHLQFCIPCMILYLARQFIDLPSPSSFCLPILPAPPICRTIPLCLPCCRDLPCLPFIVPHLPP